MAFKIEPLGQLEHDQSYNNLSAFPSGVSRFERLESASRLIRNRHAPTMDLVYGDRPRNTIDIFPGSDAGQPCMVYLHGGYWQLNSKEMFSILSEGVGAYGWSTAVIGHTLAPDASLTEIIVEVCAAIDWLVGNGAKYGVSGPLVTVGASAGGCLSALLQEHPSVMAGAAISGVFELAPIRDSYLNAKLQLTKHEVFSFSPQRRYSMDKPFLVAYGALELSAIVSNSEAFHVKRLYDGSDSQLLEIKDADHFSIVEELRNKDSDLTLSIMELAQTEHGPAGVPFW